MGVPARIAAGEADELDTMLGVRIDDSPRDVVGALDEVGDEDVVADPDAAVCARVATHAREVGPDRDRSRRGASPTLRDSGCS